MESMGSGGLYPIGSIKCQIHSFVLLAEVIRAEPRALKLFPVDGQRLAAFVHTLAEFPEMTVFPG
jgi:hypothetical protein